MQGSMVTVWFPVCVNEFRFIYCALIPAELTTSAIISTTTPPKHHPLPLPFQHLKPLIVRLKRYVVCVAVALQMPAASEDSPIPPP